MLTKQWFTLGCVAVLAVGAARIATAYCGAYDADLGLLVEARVDPLRSQGQAGLNEALASFDDLEKRIAEVSAQLNAASADPAAAAIAKESLQPQIDQLVSQRDAWRAAIDQIGGQRSCTVSRLFWHTDLEKAKAESGRTGRPILSLRMLGKLTDEFSCANSRFFRTSLYSNQEISEFLRTNYVLHWQSVRPVPRVTIDFGDGRKLERTLTGNSAHYVLAGDGMPLDVLPGLYSPTKFLDWLTRMNDVHKLYTTTPAENRGTLLTSYHQIQRGVVLTKWDGDLMRVGDVQRSTFAARVGVNDAQPSRGRGGAPNARQAAPVAISKFVMEQPILLFANLGGEKLEQGMDDGLWQEVANLHRAEVKLDAASVTVMRTEFPAAAQAGLRALTKSRVEDPILRVVRQFEEAISLDTVRNEYLLHRRIHEKFAAGEAVTGNVDTLNEWVYAELFLTPSSDPWLGLAPADVYTALEGGGQTIVQSTNR